MFKQVFRPTLHYIINFIYFYVQTAAAASQTGTGSDAERLGTALGE